MNLILIAVISLGAIALISAAILFVASRNLPCMKIHVLLKLERFYLKLIVEVVVAGCSALLLMHV